MAKKKNFYSVDKRATTSKENIMKARATLKEYLDKGRVKVQALPTIEEEVKEEVKEEVVEEPILEQEEEESETESSSEEEEIIVKKKPKKYKQDLEFILNELKEMKKAKEIIKEPITKAEIPVVKEEAKVDIKTNLNQITKLKGILMKF